jgi:hypothetical protein
MISLKDKLIEFAEKDHSSVEKLTEAFAELAPYFLSGGYIKVREDYRVYPTTVEFYFHAETGVVKDSIVYHRNNKYVDGDIPYFPLMTLHAHDSGYDITFENPEKEYRASVLIRAYQIWDINQKSWLKWDAKEQKFRKFVNADLTPINTQVLYLKFLLNGFSMNGECLVNWVDAKELLMIKKEDGRPRKGVDKYDEYGVRQKGIPDNRKWSFSRKEYIKIP